MFRYSLASASILAAVQAMAFDKRATGNLLKPPTSNMFAQTGSDCCCHVMPCMLSCQNMCEPEEPTVIPPNPVVAAPDPVRNVVFNLDVILTTLMHN